ncbi:unnamed protein product [Rhizophagus irregularis]|uniref:Uncharacterized protein n=1 Tax=Rhizophagus irregularis TaxID=588596 RepID=A0A915YYY7_9GLOM|nr:unnamed protein product [Rhizophagus irregularis]
MKEVLKQYLEEFYRGFAGFELEHLQDFHNRNMKFNLAEYEIQHLEKDEIYGPGIIPIGILDNRKDKPSIAKTLNYKMILTASLFTMKLGGETFAKIIKKILRENSSEGAAAATTSRTTPALRWESPTSNPMIISQVVVDPNATMTKDGKQLTAEEWNKEKTQIIDEMKACVEQSREKVNEANFLLKESTDARDKAKARIKSLENDLKIERVQIKSLENDVRILEQEKKKAYV